MIAIVLFAIGLIEVCVTQFVIVATEETKRGTEILPFMLFAAAAVAQYIGLP